MVVVVVVDCQPQACPVTDTVQWAPASPQTRRDVSLRTNGILQLHDAGLVPPRRFQHEVEGVLLARQGHTLARELELRQFTPNSHACERSLHDVHTRTAQTHHVVFSTKSRVCSLPVRATPLHVNSNCGKLPQSRRAKHDVNDRPKSRAHTHSDTHLLGRDVWKFLYQVLA